MARRMLVLVAAVALAGCRTEVVPPSKPVPAEPTPAASIEVPVDLPVAGLLFACGDEVAFPAEALFGPPGAKLAATEQADALRAFLAMPGPEIDRVPKAGWRVLVATPEKAMFVAGDPTVDGGLTIVSFGRSTDGWDLEGWGGCTPTVALGNGVGPAEWMLDPAGPKPGPETRSFAALVTERACASGRPPDGRIRPPLISYGRDAVLLVFGVVPLAGGQDCQGNPSGRVIVELREPLGNRRLLDGALFPPHDTWNPGQP